MRFPLKTLMAAFAASLLFTAVAQAGFWRCELPGGIYMVSLPTIASVSTHEYIVDGAARVTELTVATNSAVVARFYYVEPMVPKTSTGVADVVMDKVQQHASDAAAKAGVEEVWKKVGKNYAWPNTTHAHTVEYRLESLDQVKQLQTSLENAMRKGVDTRIKVGSSEDSGS